MIRVLYVDDEVGLLEVCKAFLEINNDLSVDVCTSVKEAEEKLRTTCYNAIVSDYQMPAATGIDFLKGLRSRGDKTPFILLTGKSREEVVIEALNSGADFYLQKGGSPTAQFKELEYKILEAVHRREAEEAVIRSNIKLNAAMHLANIGYWALDLGSMLFTVDDLTLAILGTNAEREGGYELPYDRYLSVFVHPDDRNKLHGHVGIVRSDPSTDSLHNEYRIITNDGSVRSVCVTSGIKRDPEGRPIALHGAIHDVTAQKENETRLVRLNRELMAVRAINSAIVRVRSENELLLETCRIACDVGGYRLAWIGFPANDDKRSIEQMAWAGSNGEMIPAFKASWADDERVNGPTGEAIRTGKTVFIQDWERETKATYWRELALEHKYRSMISLPILDGSKVLGALSLYSLTPNDFSPNEIELLEDMVRDLAYGILNLRSALAKEKAEEALKTSEEKFSKSFYGTAAAMALSRMEDGRYFEVNDRWLRMHGWTRDEVIGRTSTELKIWDGPNDRAAIVDELRRNGSFNDKEWVFHKKNGEEWVSLLSCQAIDIHGEQVILASILDITERKRSEVEANRQMALLKAIANNTPDALFVKDLDGKYLLLNKHWVEIIGKEADDVLGSNDTALFAPDVAESIMAEDREVMKNNELLAYEETVTLGGKKLTLLNKKSPLIDSGGNIIGVIGYYTDITEIKLLERAIRRANKQLGMMTEVTRHDMMRQLSTFDGYARLLEKPMDGLERAEVLGKIEKSIHAMKDQLEFTKQYQELGSNVPIWQNIHALVGKVSGQMDLSGLEILEHDTNILILADPLLERVLFNLVENVVRHGGNARHLTIRSREENGKLTLIFEDDGHGIRVKDRHHLFKRGYGNHTGIGLYMSREILNLTDMEIKETSQNGKGARFEITVPSGNYKL